MLVLGCEIRFPNPIPAVQVIDTYYKTAKRTDDDEERLDGEESDD